MLGFTASIMFSSCCTLFQIAEFAIITPIRKNWPKNVYIVLCAYLTVWWQIETQSSTLEKRNAAHTRMMCSFFKSDFGICEFHHWCILNLEVNLTCLCQSLWFLGLNTSWLASGNIYKGCCLSPVPVPWVYCPIPIRSWFKKKCKKKKNGCN